MKLKKQKGNVIAGLLLVAIIGVGIAGWGMNIAALVKAPALAAWGGIEILRVIGIFLAPLGAVMGWF